MTKPREYKLYRLILARHDGFIIDRWDIHPEGLKGDIVDMNDIYIEMLRDKDAWEEVD